MRKDLIRVRKAVKTVAIARSALECGGPEAWASAQLDAAFTPGGAGFVEHGPSPVATHAAILCASASLRDESGLT